jgi:hypothetical protein
MPQVIMTFTLISTVYACGIAKPGHGSMTPLAVGFSLVACAGAGGKYSGTPRVVHDSEVPCVTSASVLGCTVHQRTGLYMYPLALHCR